MKLDKERIVELINAADTRWYRQHPSPTSNWSYREHLDFTADYVARNYNKNHDKKPRQEPVKKKEESSKVPRLL